VEPSERAAWAWQPWHLAVLRGLLLGVAVVAVLTAAVLSGVAVALVQAGALGVGHP
jgi:hypothetical protein